MPFKKSQAAKTALQYEPPGAWMPKLPQDCYRLSAGYPAPETIPTTQIMATMDQLIRREGDAPFHYLGSPSAQRLVEQLQARCRQRGISSEPGECLVTAGACQAVEFAARALLDRESLVIVEGPTYMEALEVFRNYTSQILDVPLDQEGLQVDLLEERLQKRRAAGLSLPTLVYTIASYQNPTGACLSVERRQKLLALADDYDFYILEDDAYGELGFGETVPSLKSLDRSGRVIYIGSLSKVVAPGLRIGWIIADSELTETMRVFQKDLGHAFTEAVTSEYLASIDLTDRVAQLQTIYQERCHVMLTALRAEMPANVQWWQPQGGFFVWLETPGLRTAELLPAALEAGVAYVPGRYFYFQEGGGLEHLRLSFSHLPAKQLIDGVKVLGQVLKLAYGM